MSVSNNRTPEKIKGKLHSETVKDQVKTVTNKSVTRQEKDVDQRKVIKSQGKEKATFCEDDNIVDTEVDGKINSEGEIFDKSDQNETVAANSSDDSEGEEGRLDTTQALIDKSDAEIIEQLSNETETHSDSDRKKKKECIRARKRKRAKQR